jgi:Zn-finger protein
MPKNEHGLQSVTTWVKTILGVRDLTSCHTLLSKQRANNIGIQIDQEKKRKTTQAVKTTPYII